MIHTSLDYTKLWQVKLYYYLTVWGIVDDITKQFYQDPSSKMERGYNFH